MRSDISCKEVIGEKTIVGKLHRKQGKVVFALCDEELLNKKIVDKDKNIEIFVSKEFYGEKRVDGEEIKKCCEMADSINAMGNEACEILNKLGYVEENAKIEINGINHVIIMFLD